MNATLRWLLSLTIAVAIPLLILERHAFTQLDFLVRVCLAECNRYWNRARIRSQTDPHTSTRRLDELIACLVGYREEPQLFEKVLKAIKDAECRCLVVGIDGNQREDLPMLERFQKVFKDERTCIVNLHESVGKKFLRACRDRPLDEHTAFLAAYSYLKEQLKKTKVFDGEAPNALCFSQPHGDLKEIRTSAWLVSLILADTYGYNFLWSSDSDTIVQHDALAKLLRVLKKEPTVGGGSVFVRLHNKRVSAISRMASAAFSADTYLNRAALGALGSSECLHGPATMFRLDALRSVIVSWYRFRYFSWQEQSAINEDLQYTMLLAQQGWNRLYVEDAFIQTRGPESLRQWLGQRLRWSRGFNLHRFFDAPYLVSQGPLTIWYACRTAFYDVLIYIWIAWYATTGRKLFEITASDIVWFEILPPLYNIVRCADSWSQPLSSTALYALYRFICPSYRMYTFLTPLEFSWGLPSPATAESRRTWLTFLKREHDSIFFVLWVALATAAGGRALSEAASLRHGSLWSLGMGTGGSLMGVHAMFGASSE